MALEAFESCGIVRRSEGGPVWDSPRIKSMPFESHFLQEVFPWDDPGAFF